MSHFHPDPEKARRLLCELGDAVRDAIVRRRTETAEMAGVSRESVSDTIYAIDEIGEEALREWFQTNWPGGWPVEIVAEGLEEDRFFPRGIDPAETRWKCIIDPIDGTRGLMYDKRSAWVLAALAPQRGPGTMLSDCFVAAMTEIPTSKQWRADQASAVRGGGLVAGAVDVISGGRLALELRPSRAADFRHGFASLAKYFPEGKAITARLEEQLWGELYGLGAVHSPVIFDDQYISTGGQFYELLAGRDRMVGDLRPLILRAAGIESSLVCHPYDICTALLLAEAGVVLEAPLGGAVDVRLDLTSPVTWVAYANETLAAQARPILQRLLRELLQA